MPAVGARVGELLALGRRGGSAALDVGGGVRAIVEYGVLRFARGERGRAPAASSASRCRARSQFGAWELQLHRSSAAAAAPLARRRASACSTPTRSGRAR